MSASALTWIAGAGAVWLAALVVVWALCRAAALGDAHQSALLLAPTAASDVVARALVTLEIDSALLVAGDPGGAGLEVVAEASRDRPGADALAAHLQAAAEAMTSRRSVERPWDAGAGGIPGGRIAASPVGAADRQVGALVVSSRHARPRLTFAERRALRTLASHAERTLATRPVLTRERR